MAASCTTGLCLQRMDLTTLFFFRHRSSARAYSTTSRRGWTARNVARRDQDWARTWLCQKSRQRRRSHDDKHRVWLAMPEVAAIMIGDPMQARRTEVTVSRSEEHTSELQSHRDLHSFPTRRSSDLTRPHRGADGRRGTSPGAIRIGLAHGSVKNLGNEGEATTISIASGSLCPRLRRS